VREKKTHKTGIEFETVELLGSLNEKPDVNAHTRKNGGCLAGGGA